MTIKTKLLPIHGSLSMQLIISISKGDAYTAAKDTLTQILKITLELLKLKFILKFNKW